MSLTYILVALPSMAFGLAIGLAWGRHQHRWSLSHKESLAFSPEVEARLRREAGLLKRRNGHRRAPDALVRPLPVGRRPS